MKIGSIVQCVGITNWSKAKAGNIKLPKVESIYQVRGFWNIKDYPGLKGKLNFGGDTGVYLEEIVNKKVTIIGFKIEPSFEPECFKELLPPMDILEKIRRDTEIVEIVEI